MNIYKIYHRKISNIFKKLKTKKKNSRLYQMTDILFILKIYKCLLCNNNTITRNNNVLLIQFLKEIQKRKILLDFVKQLLFINCFLKNFYQKHCRQVEKIKK